RPLLVVGASHSRFKSEFEITRQIAAAFGNTHGPEGARAQPLSKSHIRGFGAPSQCDHTRLISVAHLQDVTRPDVLLVQQLARQSNCCIFCESYSHWRISFATYQISRRSVFSTLI